MAEFLTTEGISLHLERIIKESRKKVALVSPYLQLSMPNFELLKEASNRNIEITLIHGKTPLNKNARNALREIENVQILFLKDLHSKCYLNETTLLITSMNLIEYSQKNNREMGILFEKSTDTEIFYKAIAEVKSILESSIKVKLFKSNNFIENYGSDHSQVIVQKLNFEKELYRNLNHGFCIRCRKQIEYNRDQPYCEICFSRWTNSQNHNDFERNCHSCGKHNYSTINNPECSSCLNEEKLIRVNS